MKSKVDVSSTDDLREVVRALAFSANRDADHESLSEVVLALCDEVDRLRNVARGIAGAYTVADAHGNYVITAEDMAALREMAK